MPRAVPLNEYDLGLPVPLAPLDERRRAVPETVWSALRELRARAQLVLGPRLREVRLFGSYARGQADEESDVDVLLLVDELSREERNRLIGAAVDVSSYGVVLAPLVLTLADLERLRSREHILALDLDREGIVV